METFSPRLDHRRRSVNRMDWQQTYTDWSTAIAENRNADAHKIIDVASASIPRERSADRWDWCVSALQEPQSASFVLAVFWRHSIPRALFSHFLRAGVRFGNASTIKHYVLPCVESSGIEAVEKWFCDDAQTLDLPDLWTKHEMARYWYDRAGRQRH
jgi:hypothetical protein